jgi:hypothetical protein
MLETTVPAQDALSGKKVVAAALGIIDTLTRVAQDVPSWGKVAAAAAGLKLRPPVFVSDASNKLSLGPSGNVDLLIQKPVFDMPANGVEVGCNEWSIGNSGSEAFDDDSPLTDPKLVEADSNEWDFGNSGSAAFDDDSPLIGLGDPKLEAQGWPARQRQARPAGPRTTHQLQKARIARTTASWPWPRSLAASLLSAVSVSRMPPSQNQLRLLQVHFQQPVGSAGG